MKNSFRVRGMIVALAIGMMVPVTANAATIVDPSFEETPNTSWSKFGNAFFDDVTTPRTGLSSLKMFGNFDGDPNFTGAFQDFVVGGPGFSVGDQIQLVGFAQTVSGDSIAAGPNEAFLEITWLNGDGVEFGFGQNQSAVVTNGSVENEWIELSTANGIIDPGAATIRAKVVFINRGFSGGAVFFDDVTLSSVSAIPEPSSMAFLALGGIAVVTGSRRRRK